MHIFGGDRRKALSRVWFLGLLASLLAVPACMEVVDLLIQPYANYVLEGINRFGSDPGTPQYTAKSFVNWETPQVSPLTLSPDGGRLFAVNTPAARVEVFDVTDAGLAYVKAIPVGLDPVTVRARGRDEVWVANWISGTVSIVDVERGAVTRTLQTEPEPTDIAFAAGRAFVVSRQRNLVQVFDLADLTQLPVKVPLAGLHPRAAALSPDGSTLYVAIFESGNQTTVLLPETVSDPAGPYGGANPPPNAGEGMYPPITEGLKGPPATGLIVRFDPATGGWWDDNGHDWRQFVTWGLHDHDVAAIDTQTLAVSYVRGLMNLNMQLAVRADGAVTVVGTEALNQIRFEPNLTAKFVRSRLAVVSPEALDAPQVSELNGHLQAVYDSAVTTLPLAERAASIADPRAVVWSPDGQRGYVAGMGSNNVAVIDVDGARVATFDVGQGPTGLALDEAHGRLYVLNRFDASIAAYATGDLTPLQVVNLYDPTPAAIRNGRPFLYDARLTSGLGVTACASCHIDGRVDQLAWDLGVPNGAMKPFDQACKDIAGGRVPKAPKCQDFHPMKGPMTTQTLQSIIGAEPLHWRGDRRSLSDFNIAYVGLLGNDRELTADEMAAFEAFLTEVKFPPNPNRNRDNSLKTELDGANPQRGEDVYLHQPIDTAFGRIHGVEPIVRTLVERQGPLLSCNACHQLPTGTDGEIITATDLTESQGFKVPQLRGIHDKVGFDRNSPANDRGFGFAHDGRAASLEEFFSVAVFDFGDGAAGEQTLQDVLAFLKSLEVETHAGVGMQVTLDATSAADPAVIADTEFMLDLADGGDVGLVVHGLASGVARAWSYRGERAFQADGAGETWTAEQLRAAAAAGEPQTWMIVPLGSEDRLGVGG